jgi:hypothetical protein
LERSGKVITLSEAREFRGWVEPATLAHVVELELKGFRAIDERECQVCCGTSAAAQCFAALDNPQAETFVAMTDNGPCAMFGAAPVDSVTKAIEEPGNCILWFLATEELFTIKKDFMRQISNWLDWLQRFYPVGINHVSVENHTALKWCEAVGFVLGPPEPHGRNNELFRMVRRTLSQP